MRKVCDYCGDKDIREEGGWYICRNCGQRLGLVDDAAESGSGPPMSDDPLSEADETGIDEIEAGSAETQDELPMELREAVESADEYALEIAIESALSGDRSPQEADTSSEPYLAFDNSGDSVIRCEDWSQDIPVPDDWGIDIDSEPTTDT